MKLVYETIAKAKIYIFTVQCQIQDLGQAKSHLFIWFSTLQKTQTAFCSQQNVNEREQM